MKVDIMSRSQVRKEVSEYIKPKVEHVYNELNNLRYEIIKLKEEVQALINNSRKNLK